MTDELIPVLSQTSESRPPIDMGAEPAGITQSDFQAMRLSEMAYEAQQAEYAREYAERCELLRAAVLKLPRREGPK
jgi:hypothetical protein